MKKTFFLGLMLLSLFSCIDEIEELHVKDRVTTQIDNIPYIS